MTYSFFSRSLFQYSISLRKTLLFVSALLTFVASPLQAASDDAPSVNSLQKIMLFRSFVQDADSCAVGFENGQPVFSDTVAQSAPITCPDAFAWVALAKTINASWWDWGLDQTVWPSNPLPLCSDKIKRNCCDPNAPINPDSQPTQCPAFRADYTNPSPLPAVPNGMPSTFVSHTGLNNINRRDPDRLLRDLEVELVFRNRAFTDYVYRNDLYTKEGLGARNRAQNSAINAGNIGDAHGLEVRFPTDAVMVKADFIHQDIMFDRNLIEDLGSDQVPNNPDYPYLTIYLTGDSNAKGNVPGYYYMVAMTNASKDLPNWHWYAIEHVANQGRCDYIGCNDSFGYTVNGSAQPGADFGSSYIPPHIVLNNDKAAGNDAIFETGKTYLPEQTGETISAELNALLTAMGIGTASSDSDPAVISSDDPAWLNYRLKGTQTQFNHATGIPTGMGASITEGGFVNSASCLSCHAQASVDEDGNSGFQGVGSTWKPNLNGLTQVQMGPPEIGFFYGLGGPSITATQIDFVWGILGAQCVKTDSATGNCKSYPDAPTIVPPLLDE